jgi:hypothetical protein
MIAATEPRWRAVCRTLTPIGHDEGEGAKVESARWDVWPSAMIGLGLVLTLAWSGSLLWLFVRMIIALV